MDFDDKVIKNLLKLFIEKRIKDLISGVNDRMTCFQNILNANIIKSIAELKTTRDVNMPQCSHKLPFYFLNFQEIFL